MRRGFLFTFAIWLLQMMPCKPYASSKRREKPSKSSTTTKTLIWSRHIPGSSDLTGMFVGRFAGLGLEMLKMSISIGSSLDRRGNSSSTTSTGTRWTTVGRICDASPIHRTISTRGIGFGRTTHMVFAGCLSTDHRAYGRPGCRWQASGITLVTSRLQRRRMRRTFEASESGRPLPLRPDQHSIRSREAPATTGYIPPRPKWRGNG